MESGKTAISSSSYSSSKERDVQKALLSAAALGCGSLTRFAEVRGASTRLVGPEIIIHSPNASLSHAQGLFTK